MGWNLRGGVLVCLCVVVGCAGVALSGGVLAEERPLANAGLDQTVQQGTTVYLDAGGSVAPDGRLTAFEWEIERPDGSRITPRCPTCELTQFRPTQNGTYAVSVTVTDADGRTASDTLYVTVTNAVPPTAAVTGPTSLSVNETGEFTLTATPGDLRLSGGTLSVADVTHDVSLGNGKSHLKHAFSAPGEYTISGTVTDSVGQTATATHTVTVTETNECNQTADWDSQTTYRPGDRVKAPGNRHQRIYEHNGTSAVSGYDYFPQDGILADVSHPRPWPWQTVTKCGVDNDDDGGGGDGSGGGGGDDDDDVDPQLRAFSRVPQIDAGMPIAMIDKVVYNEGTTIAEARPRDVKNAQDKYSGALGYEDISVGGQVAHARTLKSQGTTNKVRTCSSLVCHDKTVVAKDQSGIGTTDISVRYAGG